jgi:hypothetical protein
MQTTQTTAARDIEGAIWGRLIGPEKPTLSAATARSILELEFLEEDKARMHELAAKARAGALSSEEREEVETYSRMRIGANWCRFTFPSSPNSVLEHWCRGVGISGAAPSVNAARTPDGLLRRPAFRWGWGIGSRVEEWRGGLGRPCVVLALSVASA